MFTNKKIILFILVFVLLLIGFIMLFKHKGSEESNVNNENIGKNVDENTLYYLGHASLRIVTSEGKVIYIDPYMGSNYDLSADLVLVTHSHYDHNEVSKIKNRNNGFQLITEKDALVSGEYNSFDLGYVKVQAVEAGYNSYHDEKVCVGYVLTLPDGIKIYIAGDTSLTPQMEEIGTWGIDYAFFPCDGTYTMNIDEALEAAKKVGAKHSIPYHTISDGSPFDENIVNKFNIDSKLIIRPDEEIVLKK